MKWSQLEIVNSVCELTRFVTEVFPACIKGMECIKEHGLAHPEHRMVMQPDGQWDRSKEFESEIDGTSDSGDATKPES